MKKTLVGFIACFAVIFIIALNTTDANAVSFEQAPSAELKRIMPGSDGVLSYYDAIKAPQKSVVNIFTKKMVQNRPNALAPFMNDPLFRQFFGNQFGGQLPQQRAQSSLGSGVILTTDGYIVTNNHVIGGADQIMVILPGEKKEYAAKLIGSDPKSDLAVIKIDAANLTPIKFTDSSKLKEGDVVFAIGNPFGIGETITHGIISALGKSGVGINEYEDFIQTDAPINPGNSGGALVDSRGYFIGVNTAIISQTGQSGGIGFAIPSNMVKNIAKQLIENGKIERGYIGVNLQDLNEQARKSYGHDGVIALDIVPNSPAQKAGLKRGDLIIALNGKKVTSAAALKNEVGAMKPSDTVRLDILRDNKPMTLTLKLEKIQTDTASNGQTTQAATPNEIELASGLYIAPLTSEIQKQLKTTLQTGVVVVKIADGFGAKSGLQVGDIITQVGDMEIKNIDDAQNAKVKLGKLEGKRIFANRHGMPIMIIAE